MSFAKGTVVVSSSSKGLSGKPRPAIVVQDEKLDLFETVIVIPLTSLHGSDRSINPVISPDEKNGLEHRSMAMVQRVGPVKKTEIGQAIGMLSEADMMRINTAMILILGLGTS
jgi:mRNA interferase MazF